MLIAGAVFATPPLAGAPAKGGAADGAAVNGELLALSWLLLPELAGLCGEENKSSFDLFCPVGELGLTAEHPVVSKKDKRNGVIFFIFIFYFS